MQRVAMRDPGDRLFYRGDTKGLQLRLYRPGDELQVEARADFRAAYDAEGRKLPSGHKWTLLQGQQVLAVGGFEDIGLDTWGGWAFAGDLTPRQWGFAAMCVRACAAWLMRAEGCFIHAVAAEHRGAAATLRHMGFAPRGERLHSFLEHA